MAIVKRIIRSVMPLGFTAFQVMNRRGLRPRVPRQETCQPPISKEFGKLTAEKFRQRLITVRIVVVKDRFKFSESPGNTA